MSDNPWFLAKNASIDEFEKAYTPDMAGYEPGGTGALGGALVNPDLPARIHIATRLLDDGANPAGVDDGTNLLHILFDATSHDIPGEAPILRRLIDGGADLGGRHKKWGTPLLVRLRNTRLDDDDLGPFYDIIFSTPGIDFDVPASLTSEKPFTLAERIELWADYRPNMYERMVAYRATNDQKS